MENLSRSVQSVKIPLVVAIPDYLRDHRYDGRIVLPAAEALQILAGSIPDDSSHCDPYLQEGAEFTHLLHLDADAGSFSAFHEIDITPDGRRLSRLTTLRQGRQTQWTRSIEHVSVCLLPSLHATPAYTATFENHDPSTRWTFFDPASPRFATKTKLALRAQTVVFADAPLRGQGPPKNLQCALPGYDFQKSRAAVVDEEGSPFSFSCRQLYADLVPFGPAYHNVVGEVSLDPAGAVSTVSGGDFPEAVGVLGSPFPFDAAMHLACAWGQRYRNVVAFPVGFDRREILCPTSSGGIYRCRVFFIGDEEAVLRFDIGLYGMDERPVETILGLRMRDISGGRLKPLAWVRKGV